MRLAATQPPIGIFLDRSVVGLLEDYAEEVFEDGHTDPDLPGQLIAQIDALRVLMRAASRGGWPLAISPAVVAEGPTWYAAAVAEHWREAREAWGIRERGLAPMTLVATLPAKDQLILAEAYRSGCEAVLTNDLAWIRAKHRRTLAAMGLAVHTPAGLVTGLRPLLGLWL